MFHIRLGATLAVLAVTSGSLIAADNPTVKALHQQIDTLKAQEKVNVKAVQTWYDEFIKRDIVTEEVAVTERKILHAQEEELLAVTSDPDTRKAIKAHYDSLREYLRVGGKLDAAAVKKLREMKKAHVAQVSSAYKLKIAELELAAKVAAKKK